MDKKLRDILDENRRCKIEIKRLRDVLSEIVDSRPDEHLDLEKYPVLSRWILDTCQKSKVGKYPQ